MVLLPITLVVLYTTYCKNVSISILVKTATQKRKTLSSLLSSLQPGVRLLLVVILVAFQFTSLFVFLPQKVSAEDFYPSDYNLEFKSAVKIDVINVTIGAGYWEKMNDDTIRDFGGDPDEYDETILKKINDAINEQAQGEYTDGNIDNDWDWYHESSAGCKSRLSDGSDKGYPDIYRDSHAIEFKELSIKAEGGPCRDITGGEGDLKVKRFEGSDNKVKTSKAHSFFLYSNKDTIVRADGKGKEHKRGTEDPNKFYNVDEDGGQCQDFVEIDPAASSGDTHGANYYELDDSRSSGGYGEEDYHDCYAWKRGWNEFTFDTGFDSDNGFTIFNITVGDALNADDDPTNDTDSSSGSVDGEGGDIDAANIDCEVQILNPLTWIACPLIEAAQKAVEQFDAAITNKLTIKTDEYFETSSPTGSAFYAAWASIRTISLSLLVLAGLVMVISQMISVNVFDAYTIKKLLPRIMVAVVLTALSWELMQFAIDLSNAAGQGVRHIIYAPFSSAGFTETKVNAGLASLLGFGASAALIGLGMLGMMSFAITAFLAVLIGFGLIVFREMLIMLLVIAAPLAIACYIMPNTQKAWKLWWDFFMKALLVFPIIVGMIAIGRVFALIATNSGGPDGPGLMEQVIAFIAYYGPYFMLPAAFRMAGGAMATISGFANDKSRGAFDRLKKYRQGKTAENMQNMKSGSRFQERNAVARRFNRASAGAATGLQGHFGLGARGRQAVDLNSQALADEALKRNPALQKLAFHDDGNAVMALSGGSRRGAEDAARDLFTDEHGNYDQARADRALAAASAVGFSRQNAQAALTTVAQNKARAVGAGDWRTVQNGVERLAGNNREQEENLRQNFQFHARSAGRFDIGSSVADANGQHTIADASGGAARGSLYQMANAHPHSITGWGNDLVNDLNDHSGTAQEVAARHDAVSVAHKELQAALPNATGETRDAIVEQLSRLDAVGVTPGVPGATGTLRAHDNGLTGDTATEVFDRARGDTNSSRYDPAYVASWTPADLAAGQRQRAQTVADVTRARARTYERPDPNHL